MTTTSDASAPLPLRAPSPPGEGKTTSTTAAEMKRHLDAGLGLREAIEADGQDPATFDISRGVSGGVDGPGGKSVDDLRADLYREAGASKADIAFDRLHRGVKP
jgi:hypothetical protein